MQIEVEPPIYDIGDIHHPFTLDDTESRLINYRRRLIQKCRFQFLTYPNLDVRYIAIQDKEGFRVNCQISTEPMIKAGLIRLERDVRWLAHFTNEVYEYSLSTLRVTIQLPDKTEHEATPCFDRIARGGYEFNDWTQTYPHPNGRFSKDLFVPKEWNLLDLRSQITSTRLFSLPQTSSQSA